MSTAAAIASTPVSAVRRAARRARFVFGLVEHHHVGSRSRKRESMLLAEQPARACHHGDSPFERKLTIFGGPIHDQLSSFRGCREG